MMLIPDPNGPVERFPHRPGGPLRFREATPRELYLWRCRDAAGGTMTAEQEREAGAYFDAHLAPTASTQEAA